MNLTTILEILDTIFMKYIYTRAYIKIIYYYYVVLLILLIQTINIVRKFQNTTLNCPLFLCVLQQYVEICLLKPGLSTCANCKVNKKPDDVKLCLQQDVAIYIFQSTSSKKDPTVSINITEPLSFQSTETKKRLF